jgi:glycosyltransferase involved in cell wall biosynthesis
MNVLNLLKYSPDFGGGIASHLGSLGNKLASEGHRLFLGFPEKRDWQNDLLNCSKIIIIPEINTALSYSFKKAIRDICRKEDIDIVHIHFSFAMSSSLALSFRKFELPIIYHWHNPPVVLNDFLTPSKSFIGKIKRIFSMAAAKFSDRIITQHISMSEEISNLLITNGWTTKNKIYHIPNGIQVLDFPERNWREKLKKVPVIGTVANFRPQKDHITLLKGFKILLEAGMKCELWIVGDGPTKPAMEELAYSLGVMTQVRFLGTLSNPSEVMRQFDVFVLSTNYEGHPLVILEAMTLGLPIVASNISSIPELITNGINGLLVNPKDPSGLAMALEKILNDNLLYTRLSMESRKSLDNQITIDDWAEQVISIYKKVLNSRQY